MSNAKNGCFLTSEASVFWCLLASFSLLNAILELCSGNEVQNQSLEVGWLSLAHHF